MKVLTLKFSDGNTVEVHMLNPGEHFPGFGGSRHDLVVGKTASMVLRRTSRMSRTDSERDIHDPAFWTMIARMLDGTGDLPVEVTASQDVVGDPV